MPISTELKERIYTAADELFSKSETGEWPTVEEVRRLSRAGMASVVECMRDWRARQRQPAKVEQPLPSELLEVVQEAATHLWSAAQSISLEKLAAQQAVLEAERSEMLELSAQQSTAFEAQEADLERLQNEIVAMSERLSTSDKALQTKREIAAKAAHEAAIKQGTNEATIAQLQKQLDVSKAEQTELRAYQKQQTELMASQSSENAQYRAENKTLRERVEKMEKMHVEQINASTEALSSAREECLQLKGELAGLKAAYSELLMHEQSKEMATPVTGSST